MKARRVLVDTNLIVRHLVQDDEEQAQAAGRLFERCDRGELNLVILPAVLAECVFVLESFYERSRGEIASALRVLITSAHAEVSQPGSDARALQLYAETKLHFVDCAVVASGAALGIPVATFDREIRKLPSVKLEKL